MKKIKKGRKLPKFLNESQAVKFLSAINQKCITGCRNYAILMIMYRAGLRNSEVCNLAPLDVMFENDMLYIQNGKGGKDRYVPMTPDLKEALQSWANVRPDSNYFFSTMKGGKLNDRYLRELCYRTSAKAEVYLQDGAEKKLVNPHALRHSCMTSLLREGFNIREVQDIAGHERVTTTQIYTHVTMDEMAGKFKNRKSIMV